MSSLEQRLVALETALKGERPPKPKKKPKPRRRMNKGYMCRVCERVSINEKSLCRPIAL